MSALHSLIALPEGKTLSDLVPALAGIKGEIRIGKPNAQCACCRKLFSAARKRYRRIRLASLDVVRYCPIAVEYHICRKCFQKHERGGIAREGFLAAVEAFHRGEVAQ